MGKEEIRDELIQRRESMGQDQWIKNSRAITKKILKSKIYNKADKLLVYADFRNEVETMTIIEEALIEGKDVYLPKVLEGFEEARMEFYKVNSTFELVNGYMGINEPTASNDKAFTYAFNPQDKILMLVPGVAFDKKGNRLGYGKGYYDNYLADKPSILKVGICFSLQIVDDLPADDKDVKLDYLISELTDTKEIDSFEYSN